MTHMHEFFLVYTDGPHTRFSAADNRRTLHALMRPAAEKRQCTKSRREVARWRGRGLWGFGRGAKVERVGVERKNKLILLKPAIGTRG